MTLLTLKVTKIMMIHIAIIQYPNSLKSAIYGLSEMFELATTIGPQQAVDVQFKVDVINPLDKSSIVKLGTHERHYDVVIMPPCNVGDYYLQPHQYLLDWLIETANKNTLLTSACAGTFILAAANVLKDKTVTTHWGLEMLFKEKHPHIELAIEKILISQGNIITAAGMMSWVDLGLEIVAQFSHPNVMRLLGKELIIDTGIREQRFYQQFIPNVQHGDKIIIAIQNKLKGNYSQRVIFQQLAQDFHLTERTFLRRFVKATGLKPSEYLQKLRIQKACELLETNSMSFDGIALKVGYEDAGACRKLFLRTMGLTPKEFKKRFSY